MPEPEPTISEVLASTHGENDAIMLDDIREAVAGLGEYSSTVRQAMRSLTEQLELAEDDTRRNTTYEGEQDGTQPHNNEGDDPIVFSRDTINRLTEPGTYQPLDATTTATESDDFVQPEALGNCTCRSCNEPSTRPSPRGNIVPSGARRDDRRTAAARRLP